MKLLLIFFSTILLIFSNVHAQSQEIVKVYKPISGYKDYVWDTKLDVFKQDFKDHLYPTDGVPGEPFTYYAIYDEFVGDSATVYFAFLEDKLIRVWIDYSYANLSDMQYVALFNRLVDYFNKTYGPATKDIRPDNNLKSLLEISGNIKDNMYIWYAEWNDQYGRCWMQLAASEGSLFLYVYLDSKYLIDHFPNIQSGIK